jgi:hypothetical protein
MCLCTNAPKLPKAIITTFPQFFACLRSVASKVLTGKIVVLDESGSQSDAIDMIPDLLRPERGHLCAHGALYHFHFIRGGGKASVEQTNHVIAGLAVGEDDLIGDIYEEAHGIWLFGGCRELRVSTRGPGFDAVSAERSRTRVLGAGDCLVGVACGVECRGVRVCTVGLRAFNCDCVVA